MNSSASAKILFLAKNSCFLALLFLAGCAKSFRAEVSSLPPASSNPSEVETPTATNNGDNKPEEKQNAENDVTTKNKKIIEDKLNPYQLSNEELDQFKKSLMGDNSKPAAAAADSSSAATTVVATPSKATTAPAKPKTDVKPQTAGSSDKSPSAPTAPKQDNKPAASSTTSDNHEAQAKTDTQAQDLKPTSPPTGSAPAKPVSYSTDSQSLLSTGTELKTSDKIIETLEMCRNLEAESDQNVAYKKRFVCKLLPPAVRMQQLVFKQRLSILGLMRKQKLNVELTRQDLDWLQQIRVQYRLNANAKWQDILERVDVTPLPLLFAQSVLESRWGLDAIAVRGNNYFGVKGFASQNKCWDRPDARGMCHRAYNSIDESVSDYIRFLNTTTSSIYFRKARRQMRENGVPFNSFTLIATLTQYSERKQWYINTISDLMKDQKFVALILSEEQPE